MGHDHGNESRRSFLKLFGATTSLGLFQSPVQVLIESIVMGAVQSAQAASAGVTPRRFVQIIQQGAPPRWTFDLFLTPYSSAGFVENPHLGNVYNFLSTGAKAQYATVQKAGLNVPHMWSFDVASSAGAMRPMDGLLNNLLVLRGIQIGNPDHGAATAMQFLPAGASQSIPALSADASDFPIPAVGMPVGGYRFVSSKSKSPVNLSNGGNLIQQMLSPFATTPAGTFATKKAKLGSALDASLNAMNQLSEGQHANVDQISKAAQAAKDLMSQGFGNLTTTWNSLVAKYTGLITRTLDPSRSLAGINDAPIINDGSLRFRINGAAPTEKDLRSMIVANMGLRLWAEHFAMAEYVLVNNLSSTVTLAPSPLYNFNANGAVYTGGLGSDEHFLGMGPSLILNTYMNMAIAACMLEFIDVLKSKNMFDDTVIALGGEFGRSARTDATGSDHGYMGASTTLYSGAIKGPMVIGNIYNSKQQDSSDSGTWGMGAPVAELGRALNINDWASTVAYLLRVPSPSTAASTLVTAGSDGVLKSLVEKAKQV